MEAGTIGTWHVAAGDSFEAGEVIAEIETDKATMGFEAQDPGVVAKILVEVGAEVSIQHTLENALFLGVLFEMHVFNLLLSLFIYSFFLYNT